MQREPDQKSSSNPLFMWIAIGVLTLLLLPLLSTDRADKLPPREPVSDPAGSPQSQFPPDASAQSDEEESYKADSIAQFRPAEEPANGYVSSSACRECHQNQHHSWHASYHRTMTQVANTETVLGNFDNQQFTFPNGGTYRLGKSGDEHWVEISDHPDMEETSGGNAIRLPIVLTTGSHHMQVYWFASGQGRNLGILPLVHLRGEERWIPRDAAFIKPPDKAPSLEFTRWNSTCNTCHTTDPRARWQKEAKHYDTKVSEFGITCESCHGPGEAHVNFQRGREKLSAADLTNTPDPIVNPSTLDHRKSSQICGACHVAHRRVDPSGKFTNYLPGTDYDKARLPLRMTDDFLDKILAGATNQAKLRKGFHEQLLAQFWPDGAIRIAGREYNGLIDSACHTKGKMSCISCHSMHQSGSDKRAAKEWANDQLQPAKMGDQGCLQCHETKDYRSTEHTHHPLNSSGSTCYNCHMPHTAYALLKAVRNHTIDSPMVDVSDKAGRPNACNLCHLDQTLEWTSKHLAKWYDLPMPQFTDEQREVATGPLWTLKGDAGLRALMAWHIGWQPARDAAITDWSAPYLAVLIDDPYPAVRVIASRTMNKTADYRQIAYDFLAPAQERRKPAFQLIAAWQKKQAGNIHNPVTLIDPNGKLQMQRFQSLINARDNRPMVLSE